jgi:hypothetical protein
MNGKIAGSNFILYYIVLIYKKSTYIKHRLTPEINNQS